VSTEAKTRRNNKQRGGSGWNARQRRAAWRPGLKLCASQTSCVVARAAHMQAAEPLRLPIPLSQQPGKTTSRVVV